MPTPEEIDNVFEGVVAWPAQALATGGHQIWEARSRATELALRHRAPWVSVHRDFVEAGGLMAFGWAPSEGRRQFELITDYLDRILRGAKPAELPVISPSAYQLAFNLRTARALGVTIPKPILLRADEVFQ